MSQSDYLKYKKSAIILKNSGDLPAIFDEQDYISYKRFSIGNSIVDTNKRFDQLVPTGTKLIFDMERAKTTTCPTTFSLCNTNQRVNRVLNKNIVNSGAKTFPFVKPIGKYVKQPAYKKLHVVVFKIVHLLMAKYVIAKLVFISFFNNLNAFY